MPNEPTGPSPDDAAKGLLPPMPAFEPGKNPGNVTAPPPNDAGQPAAAPQDPDAAWSLRPDSFDISSYATVGGNDAWASNGTIQTEGRINIASDEPAGQPADQTAAGGADRPWADGSPGVTSLRDYAILSARRKDMVDGVVQAPAEDEDPWPKFEDTWRKVFNNKVPEPLAVQQYRSTFGEAPKPFSLVPETRLRPDSYNYDYLGFGDLPAYVASPLKFAMGLGRTEDQVIAGIAQASGNKGLAKWGMMQAAKSTRVINLLPMIDGVKDFRNKFNEIPFGNDWKFQKQTFQEQLSHGASVIMADPFGAALNVTQVGIDQGPQLLLVSGAAVAGGPLAAIAVDATLTGTQMIGQSMAEDLQAQGIDATRPEGAEAALDPTTMQHLWYNAGVRSAFAAGTTALSDAVGGQPLLQKGVGMAIKPLIQGTVGGVGEWGSEELTGGQLSGTAILGAFANAAAMSPVQDGAGRGSEMLSEAIGEHLDRGLEEFSRERSMGRVEQAGVQRTRLEEISAEAQSSELRAARPHVYYQDERVKGKGTPEEYIFVPAEELFQHLQSQKVVNPVKFIDHWPGVTAKDFRSAYENRIDLRMPLATYTSKVAGTKFDPFFLDHARFDPRRMNSADAAEFLRQQAEEQAEAARRAAARQVGAKPIDASTAPTPPATSPDENSGQDSSNAPGPGGSVSADKGAAKKKRTAIARTKGASAIADLRRDGDASEGAASGKPATDTKGAEQ